MVKPNLSEYCRSSRFKIHKQARRALVIQSSSDDSDQEQNQRNVERRIQLDRNREHGDDHEDQKADAFHAMDGTDNEEMESSGTEEANLSKSNSLSDPDNDASHPDSPHSLQQNPSPLPSPVNNIDEEAETSESSEIVAGNSSGGESPRNSGSEDFPSDTERISSNDEDNAEQDVENNEELLYPGSSITVAESMFSILSLSLTHNISGTCLTDMLELLSLHCPQPNIYHRSLYMFKKYFSNLRSPLRRCFFCLQCYLPLASETQICTTCREHKGVSYFIHISVISQLQSLFKRSGFAAKLSYRFHRSKQSADNLEDVYDGQIFKELSSEGNILSNPLNLALFWSSDGVPTTQGSSRHSLWPFYISVLNLPYHERTKLENVMLAALWFGVEKPIPNLFLRPLQTEILQLNQGMHFESPEGPLFVKAIIMGGTADLPARSIFLNMKQHNGVYGCHKCKIRSEQAEPGRGPKRVYLFQRNLDLRTDHETLQFAAQAVALNTDVYGVKGHTILRGIVYQPVRSTSCDDMHPIYQGVVKKLLCLWFDDQYRNSNWSLMHLVQVIDSRLCAITPPDFVQRLPRSIQENMKYWKASELKAWLLYYSLPVLHGIMQKVYFDHWKLLVFGVYMLSKTSVSAQDIRESQNLLTEFVSRYGDLYGRCHMTCNLHQLLHLPDVVKDLGPLWVHSCFPFENLNGKLLKLVTGTRYADLQVANASALFLNLSTAKNDKLAIGRPARAFCERLSSFKKKLKMTNVSPFFAIVGKISKVRVLPDLVQDTLLQHEIQGATYHMFYRLFKKAESIVFVSESYNRVLKTKNSCVLFVNENRKAYGVILSFVRVSNCPCNDFCNQCDCTYYAIVRKCNFSTVFHAWAGLPLPFIHEVHNLNEFAAVNINHLVTVCFSVCSNNDSMYFIEPVNNVEFE